MKRNRSDSSSTTSAADEMPRLPTTAHRKTTFLNHDIMAEVARFVGVFGKDASSCFALVDQKWYQALISIFDEWKEYQSGFGLPRSDWISESGSDSTFNYRAAVIDSLKRATEGDRSRVLMEPEQYVDYDSTTRLASPLPAGLTHIILARTGHLRSEKYRALWKPVLHFLSKELQVSFLLVLPPPPIACGGLASSVTSIDSCFLFSCHSLINADLACLSSVTTIGDSFFSSCSSLTTIELDDLNSVYTIGHSFLRNCSSLTSLDLAGLSSVTTIGKCFLQNCCSLTSVDLVGLSSVATIGDDFLYNCRSLTSVDLAVLRSVTTIGKCFLSECHSLTSVDLAGLSSVTTIGDFFLDSCMELTAVELDDLNSVHTIGHSFLCNCSSLTSLDLAGLSSVTTIGRFFLEGSRLAREAALAKRDLLEQIKSR